MNIPLSPYIINYVGHPYLASGLYFEKIYHWMPIISKKHFYDHLLNPLSPPRADITLLIYCMKLLLSSPQSQSQDEQIPQTSGYLTAKRFLLEAEIAGILTLQLLQAQILVLLYEIGHAIYPAAYMSIGACARYGLALGIDEQRDMHSNQPYLKLLEQEERGRVWWAVVILDRFDFSFSSIQNSCGFSFLDIVPVIETI